MAEENKEPKRGPNQVLKPKGIPSGEDFRHTPETTPEDVETFTDLSSEHGSRQT